MPLSAHPSLQADLTHEQSNWAVRQTALVSAFVGLAILAFRLIRGLPTQIDILGLNAGIVGLALSLNRVVRLLTNQLANRLVIRYTVANAFLWALIATIGTTAAWLRCLPCSCWRQGVVGLYNGIAFGRLSYGVEGQKSQQGRLFGLFRSGFAPAAGCGHQCRSVDRLVGVPTSLRHYRRRFRIGHLPIFLQPLKSVHTNPMPVDTRF